MMGERTAMQGELLYSFSLEQHVPADHLLRSIDSFVDLSEFPRPPLPALRLSCEWIQKDLDDLFRDLPGSDARV